MVNQYVKNEKTATCTCMWLVLSLHFRMIDIHILYINIETSQYTKYFTPRWQENPGVFMWPNNNVETLQSYSVTKAQKLWYSFFMYMYVNWESLLCIIQHNSFLVLLNEQVLELKQDNFMLFWYPVSEYIVNKQGNKPHCRFNTYSLRVKTNTVFLQFIVHVYHIPAL